MPGVPGLPACIADRTNGTVTCRNLATGQNYQLIRRSGGVDDAPVSVSAGGGSQIGAQFAALKVGDAVVLKLTGNATCTTPSQDTCLTVVHVHNLTADIVNGVAGGQCQSGQRLRVGVCSFGAYSNTPIPDPDVKRITSEDDLGGGETALAVPDVINTTPLNGESMAPRFKAYADAGDLGSSLIELTITPRGGGAPLFQTPGVNDPNGVQVCAPTPATTACAAGTPGLAEGRYDARWVLASPHQGDPTAVDSSR